MVDRRQFLVAGALAGLVTDAKAAKIAQMRTLAVATVGDLTRVRPSQDLLVLVSGYSKPADGGGGMFVWKPGGYEPDQGTSFESTSRGLWQRVETGAGLHASWFGAIGDGETDDTAALQRALGAAGSSRRALTLGAGRVYSVRNLRVPRASGLAIIGNYSVIRARPGGDTSYLLASTGWLADEAEAQPSVHLSNLTIDGQSIVENSIILQSWDSDIEGCEILGARESGITITAVTRNGTAFPSSTLVNNRIRNCRVFKNGGSGLRIVDRKRNRATDLSVAGCLFYSNEGWGIDADTIGGTHIAACHFYGNRSGDLRVGFHGIGGMVRDCYFESPLAVQVERGNLPFVIQGCWFRGRLFAALLDGPPAVYSRDNIFRGARAYIERGGSDPAPTIVSQRDVFSTESPFRWSTDDRIGSIRADGSQVGAEPDTRSGDQGLDGRSEFPSATTP